MCVYNKKAKTHGVFDVGKLGEVWVGLGWLLRIKKFNMRRKEIPVEISVSIFLQVEENKVHWEAAISIIKFWYHECSICYKIDS